MNVSKAAKIWLDYHRTNSKKNTHRSYSAVMGKFRESYGDQKLSELTIDTILDFLNQLSGRGIKTDTPRCSRLEIDYSRSQKR